MDCVVSRHPAASPRPRRSDKTSISDRLNSISCRDNRSIPSTYRDGPIEICIVRFFKNLHFENITSTRVLSHLTNGAGLIVSLISKCVDRKLHFVIVIVWLLSTVAARKFRFKNHLVAPSCVVDSRGIRHESRSFTILTSLEASHVFRFQPIQIQIFQHDRPNSN